MHTFFSNARHAVALDIVGTYGGSAVEPVYDI
jgi:hypothetical protein